jgi:peptidyl-prolyl cis-trans isomerase C
MTLSHRFLGCIAVACALSLSGCGWFGFSEKENSVKPLDDPKIYASPVKGDRKGDYAREGVLNTADTAVRARPTPAPATKPTELPQYLVLGSVVANVNGTPVYGHELIKLVSPLLRAKARDLDAQQYRTVALAELKKQRDGLIRDELEYAAAQRNTSEDDKRQAQAMTYLYREKLISQAGGSQQMARQLAREQGEDFDKLVTKYERTALVQLYFQKRVFPRIEPGADELRRYYDQNREKMFSVPSQATFRVIRVDIDEVGSESMAMQRIEEARRRAMAGESIATLSDEYNKDPILHRNKGLVGPISKGAYAVDEVDQAVWQTESGKVTPAIRVKNSFYIALVENRAEGRVRAFDEVEVQQQIKGDLSKAAMVDARERVFRLLYADAVIQADDAMLAPVLEMATQMYPIWRNET